MTKYVFAIGVALVLSVSGALGLARGGPENGSPTGGIDAQTIAAAPGQDLTDTIAFLQDRLRRLPSDDRSWATLGLAYVEQARVTGNPTFYAKATEAIANSLENRPEDNAPAHSSAAALAAARHDFTDALNEADKALAIDEREAGALAVRVDALTELGRYKDQLAALRTADLRQPGIPVATRYAYAYELRGNVSRADAILRRYAAHGSHADKGHLFTLLADNERRSGGPDDVRSASKYLRLALRESPDYLPALVSRARLSVARGDFQRAEVQWREVVTRLPVPEYVTELGELYLHLGQTRKAEQQFTVVDSTVKLFAASGVDTDLETALFEADHGDADQALTDAKAEWSKRRSLHVADALGWAYHQTGQHRLALQYAVKATRLGTPEARLWTHRGLIEAALGLDAAAAKHLKYGLTIDPGASPWQAARARTALQAVNGALTELEAQQ